MTSTDPTQVCTIAVLDGCIECNVANIAAGTIVPCCRGEDVEGFDYLAGERDRFERYPDD